MTIDNVKCNDKLVGAFLKGQHGAVNVLDPSGKQRGLTSAYFVEGDRDAAFPIIDFIFAYIGEHGNITPIKKLTFDVVDHHGNVSQHVTMRNCIVTAWSLMSSEQPAGNPSADDQPAKPDVEHVRIESVDVEVHAGADTKPFRKTDPNQAK